MRATRPRSPRPASRSRPTVQAFMVTLVLLFSAALGAPIPVRAHDFHVGLAEVEHDLQEQRLEIAVRMSTRDLEDELAAMSPRPPVLESAEADTLLAALLEEHFVLSDASGAPRDLRWVGKEIGPGESWLYVDATTSSIAGWRLRYTLGMGLHPRQVNTVNLRAGAQSRSLVFTRSEPEHPLDVAAERAGGGGS